MEYWIFVFGLFGAFFAFMSFLFYILQMRVKPLEERVNSNKSYIDSEKIDLEKKIEELKKESKDFRSRVFEELNDIKLKRVEQYSDVKGKYVSNEAFVAFSDSFKEDYIRDIERLENRLRELIRDGSCE